MEITSLQALDRRIKILEEATLIITAPKEDLFVSIFPTLFKKFGQEIDRMTAQFHAYKFETTYFERAYRLKAGSVACVVDTNKKVEHIDNILDFIIGTFGFSLCTNVNCFLILVNSNPSMEGYDIQELVKYYKKIHVFYYDLLNEEGGNFIGSHPTPYGSELIVEKTSVQPRKKVQVLEPKKSTTKESSKGKEEESIIIKVDSPPMRSKKTGPTTNVYIKFPYDEDKDRFAEIIEQQITRRDFAVVDHPKLLGTNGFAAMCFSIQNEKEFLVKREKVLKDIQKPKQNGYKFVQIVLVTNPMMRYPSFESDLYNGYIFEVFSNTWDTKITGEFSPNKSIKFL